MSTIEEVNYFNDSRTGTPEGIPTVWMEDPDGSGDGDVEVELPWRWDVCPVCNGKGSHVNPSIDCGGITSDEMRDDPDFMESYFSGDYDQTCNECHGRSTVPVLDEARCTPEELELWEAECQAEADDHACRLAEIRMGA